MNSSSGRNDSDPSVAESMMKSPFPGMDPYLEDPAHWPDFHFKFINYWQENIADALPAEYEARVGERIYVIEPSMDTRIRLGPDVLVAKKRKRRSDASKRQGTATLEPVTIPNVLLEEVQEFFIQLVHRSERKVVTVLELLSPTNK